VQFLSRSQHHMDRSSLWSKLLKNLRNMTKISLHALLTSKKHMTGFFEVNFRGFYRSMSLMVTGQLLLAIKSFYCQPQVCVCINSKQSKPFHVGIGLNQVCVFSFSFHNLNSNSIEKRSQTNKCATIWNCKINSSLFADVLDLLSSTKPGLQRAINDFAAACDNTGMKISTIKTEVLHLSRKWTEEHH